MDLSYATIRDLAQRYAAKKKATGTVNKTTSTVDTIMKSLRQQYERHTGERNADMFGDLTWLTPASLKKPSESARIRPLYRGKHHPSASEANKVPLEAATVQRMLENFRSAIYGVFYHLKTLDGDHDTVLQKLKDSYDEFGTMADGLKREQAEQLLTREPSKHQEARWVEWPAIQKAFAGRLQTFADDNVASMQRTLHMGFYVLLPPSRNDFDGLRFVTDESEEALRTTRSPNYIYVADDGTMTFVLNAFKNDRRSDAAAYNPADGDFMLNHERTERFPLVGDRTLAKYGFAPERLVEMLTVYRGKLSQETNPHEYIFFNPSSSTVSPIEKDSLGKRLGRLTKDLTGKTVQSQMFRTLFLSWFDTKRPSMTDRKHLARWMMHTVEKQMDTYSKKAPVGEKRSRLGDEQEGGAYIRFSDM